MESFMWGNIWAWTELCWYLNVICGSFVKHFVHLHVALAGTRPFPVTEKQCRVGKSTATQEPGDLPPGSSATCWITWSGHLILCLVTLVVSSLLQEMIDPGSCKARPNILIKKKKKDVLGPHLCHSFFWLNHFLLLLN